MGRPQVVLRGRCLTQAMGHDHPLDRRFVIKAGAAGLGAMLLAACTSDARGPGPGAGQPAGNLAGRADSGPAAPAGFADFASTVRVVADGDFWLVESSGMPAHGMMVSITSWQQQVPVPQPYAGSNAWRVPRTPRLADHPVSARTQLYRGAIAVAVNGIPIFNALNNRGEDAFLAGELDQWGGHCGRADDYHYHVAPLHLAGAVAAGAPIAYALDGFPIYGTAEPDGSAVTGLDDFNGHEGPAGHLGSNGYHYHGTLTYPYINGGLRGVVEVREDQIEPQPVTRAFRPAGTPLRGATITSFEATGASSYRLGYTLGGGQGGVEYAVSAESVRFVFTDPSGAVRTETYARRG